MRFHYTYRITNKKSISHIGNKLSEQTKLKIGNANRNKPKPKLVCPHCGKIGGSGNMQRWHFDNCKENK